MEKQNYGHGFDARQGSMELKIWTFGCVDRGSEKNPAR